MAKRKIGERTLEIMSQAPRYNRWLVKKVERFLSGDILEIGAGIGNITPLLEKYGSVTAADYDRRYVRILKKKGFNSGFGDIEKGRYSFGRRKFDAIVCMNVLEHIKDHKKALLNMYKLLKPEGRLILLVPAHMWAYGVIDKNLGHYRRYTKPELVKMFAKTGFEKIDASYLNWFSVIPWAINGRLFKKALIPLNQLSLFDSLAPFFLWIEDFIKPPLGQSVLIIGHKR